MSFIHTIRILHALIVAMAVAVALPASAADSAVPPLLPVTDFAKQSKLSSIQFSPDGKLFAARQEFEGRMNVIVGDLEKSQLTRITSFTTYDVGTFNWISNSRLVMTLSDLKKGLGEQRGGGLFALNRDGSEPKELSPTYEACEARGAQVCRQIRFVNRINGSEDEVIAAANERDRRTDDLYRLNTKTGRKTLLTTENPGGVSEWFLDQKNVPRAGVSENSGTRTEVFWYRDSATTPWRKISGAQGEAARVKPAGFDADGSLLVYSNIGSDKYKLYAFDPIAGKPTNLIAEHPNVDLDTGTLLTRLSDHKVVGIRIEADKPEVVWFDETYAKLQKLMDASLPAGNINQITLLADGKVSVFASGDRDPGQYYLYDPKIKRLEEVLRPLEWIKPQQMAGMQVIRYKARDGLEIPGYLTLPQGRPPTKLPLVALIHGGPWARDEWGYNPDVQFLANRGYAVFQPNYRGSTGFGAKHYVSGFRQLGQTMQDDITDGVRYLIDQGIVDKDRMCINGGSYGGYATMMALVKEPDLFKCGIDEAGVVDLIWWQELGYTDFNLSDPDAAEAFLKVALGDLKTDRAMLEKYSPRLHADQIKAPVLIVHAVRDQRVPIAHAEGMRDALKAAGKTYEWVVYPDEAHGFIKMENRIDRYNKIEAFLQKYIGR